MGSGPSFPAGDPAVLRQMLTGPLIELEDRNC
jgi:hypothetical protein